MLRNIYRNYLFGKNQYPYAPYQTKYNCIFIHITKNAGSSIIDALNNGMKTPRIHAYWKEYQLRSQFRYNKYFKFSFVRNPWDRAVSTYFYIQKLKLKGNSKWTSFELMEFNTFDEFVINYLDKDRIWSHRLLFPQWFFIVNEADELQVDFLGKYENLDYDFNFIKKKIGLENRDLKILNSTERKSYQEYYSEETRDKIAFLYSKDIEFFDYQF